MTWKWIVVFSCTLLIVNSHRYKDYRYLVTCDESKNVRPLQEYGSERVENNYAILNKLTADDYPPVFEPIMDPGSHTLILKVNGKELNPSIDNKGWLTLPQCTKYDDYCYFVYQRNLRGSFSYLKNHTKCFTLYRSYSDEVGNPNRCIGVDKGWLREVEDRLRPTDKCENFMLLDYEEYNSIVDG